MKGKRCPDCGVMMQYIDTMYLDYKDSVQKIADPYYKCPKCKIEIDAEELEEQ